jgi:hypothetical protein
VRLRAARNMPPVISTIVMSRFFTRRRFASTSAYFTDRLTPPGHPWPTSVTPGRYPSGRAARGSVVPRKMACPLACGAFHGLRGSRPSTRAQGRGSLTAAPFNREQKWTRRRATLLCLPPSRCFAQWSPGQGIEIFWARPFLRSV